MPIISEDIYLNCSLPIAYNKLKSLKLEEKINQKDSKITITYKSDRISKYTLGCTDATYFEKMLFPEKNLIISNRLPKNPFEYMIFIYSFEKTENGTMIKYIQDFELDSSNKDKEQDMLVFLKMSSNNVIQQIHKIMSE